MRNAKTILALALGCAVGLLAQSIYVPVKRLTRRSWSSRPEKAHPELQKLGLHVIPPGQTEYAIIANTFPSKIGKKSSAADLTVLTTGKATVKSDDRGKFFDLCLPISDSAGRPIGITVMEIPYRSPRIPPRRWPKRPRFATKCRSRSPAKPNFSRRPRRRWL